MRTVYLDSVLVLNFAMDLAMLVLTSRLCAVPYKLPRAIAAAILGAGYSAAEIILGGVLGSMPVKLLCAALMAAIVFGFGRTYLRTLLVFLAVSAAFSGLGSISGGSVTVLFCAFFGAWAVYSAVFHSFLGAKLRSREAELEITFRGRTVRVNALIDTGNRLRDPLRSIPVTICSLEALAPLLDRETAAILRRFSPVEAVERLGAGFTLIPYGSLGGEGFLAAFIPDSVTLGGRKIRCAVAADTGDALSGSGYAAISYEQ